MRAETLSELLGSVYDCALDPIGWARTLPLISAFGESAASSVVVHDREADSRTRVFEHGAEQSFLRLYFEKLVLAQSPPVQSLTFDRPGDVATMTMLAGEREIQNSDFYVKWVKPLGFRDVIGVFVLKSGRRIGWFSLARSDVQARYGDRDLKLLGALSPHICRALLISDAFDLQSVAAARLEATVDNLSTSIFLTEEQGRITYMNSSAERLVAAGSSLSARSGRLAAVEQGARQALSRALTQSSLGKAPSTTGRHAIPLPNLEGGGLIANVLPLEWRMGRNPLASLPGGTAVIVQDPATPSTPPLEAFGQLYGLTAGELKVLEHVGDGRTPQDTADQLGISLTTVKTHLQKLFAKTNTNRQADLVHLLAQSTPPLRSR